MINFELGNLLPIRNSSIKRYIKNFKKSVLLEGIFLKNYYFEEIWIKISKLNYII